MDEWLRCSRSDETLNMDNQDNIKSAPKSLLPTTFEFSINIDGAFTYRVSWLPDIQMLELRLDRFENILGKNEDPGNPPMKRAKVSESQWTVFWAIVNQVKVWNWDPKYSNNMLDGASWSLNIKYRGQRIKTEGNNAFPGSKGSGFQADSDFGLFVAALNMLLGCDYLPQQIYSNLLIDE